MKSVFSPEKDGFLTGRRIEWFHHTSLPEWGYAEEQTDTFTVLHPSGDCAAETYPLYVVFHSAGHDVYSTVACTWQPGNHDIYHDGISLCFLELSKSLWLLTKALRRKDGCPEEIFQEFSGRLKVQFHKKNHSGAVE